MTAALIFSVIIVAAGRESPSSDVLYSAWELYVSRNDFVNGTCRRDVDRNSSPSDPAKQLHEYGARDGFLIRKSNYGGAGNNRCDIFARNPDYSFELNKDLTTGKWALKYVVRNTEEMTTTEASLRASLTWLRRCMFCPVNPREDILHGLRDGQFRMVDIKESHDGAWLDIQLRAEGVDLAKRLTSRSLRCRCQNRPPYYLPVSFHVEGIWGSREIEGKLIAATHEIALEYQDHAGFPVIKRVHHVYLFPEEQVDSRFEEVVSYVLSSDPPPVHHFYLSHYGFPEVFAVDPPKPTPWFLYFSAGGFGLFFLAFFLWRVLAKRQARGVS